MKSFQYDFSKSTTGKSRWAGRGSFETGFMSTKRTYKPSKIRRARKTGFRARNKTRSGRRVLKRRQLKRRKRLAYQPK